jgi:hypothetical protein
MFEMPQTQTFCLGDQEAYSSALPTPTPLLPLLLPLHLALLLPLLLPLRSSSNT